MSSYFNIKHLERLIYEAINNPKYGETNQSHHGAKFNSYGGSYRLHYIYLKPFADYLEDIEFDKITNQLKSDRAKEIIQSCKLAAQDPTRTIGVSERVKIPGTSEADQFASDMSYRDQQGNPVQKSRVVRQPAINEPNEDEQKFLYNLFKQDGDIGKYTGILVENLENLAAKYERGSFIDPSDPNSSTPAIPYFVLYTPYKDKEELNIIYLFTIQVSKSKKHYGFIAYKFKFDSPPLRVYGRNIGDLLNKIETGFRTFPPKLSQRAPLKSFAPSGLLDFKGDFEAIAKTVSRDPEPIEEFNKLLNKYIQNNIANGKMSEDDKTSHEYIYALKNIYNKLGAIKMPLKEEKSTLSVPKIQELKDRKIKLEKQLLSIFEQDMNDPKLEPLYDEIEEIDSQLKSVSSEKENITNDDSQDKKMNDLYKKDVEKLNFKEREYILNKLASKKTLDPSDQSFLNLLGMMANSIISNEFKQIESSQKTEEFFKSPPEKQQNIQAANLKKQRDLVEQFELLNKLLSQHKSTTLGSYDWSSGPSKTKSSMTVPLPTKSDESDESNKSFSEMSIEELVKYDKTISLEINKLSQLSNKIKQEIKKRATSGGGLSPDNIISNKSAKAEVKPSKPLPDDEDDDDKPVKKSTKPTITVNKPPEKSDTNENDDNTPTPYDDMTIEDMKKILNDIVGSNESEQVKKYSALSKDEQLRVRDLIGRIRAKEQEKAAAELASKQEEIAKERERNKKTSAANETEIPSSKKPRKKISESLLSEIIYNAFKNYLK